MDFKLLKEKQHLITLLKLLAYVKRIKLHEQKFNIQVSTIHNFPLRKFLKFINKKTNYYQVKKLKTFFDLVKKILLLSPFRIRHYRMLVTFPKYLFTSQNKIF
jgi:hypothetical protein